MTEVSKCDLPTMRFPLVTASYKPQRLCGVISAYLRVAVGFD
jgi:hypothetical protein